MPYGTCTTSTHVIIHVLSIQLIGQHFIHFLKKKVKSNDHRDNKWSD